MIIALLNQIKDLSLNIVNQQEIPKEVHKNRGNVCDSFPSHSLIIYGFSASSSLWMIDECVHIERALEYVNILIFE